MTFDEWFRASNIHEMYYHVLKIGWEAGQKEFVRRLMRLAPSASTNASDVDTYGSIAAPRGDNSDSG